MIVLFILSQEVIFFLPDTIKYTLQILDIKKVIVGESVYYDGTQMKDIWGNHAILAYVPENPQTIDEPSFGYTIRNDRYPIVEKVRDELATSDVILVRDMTGVALLSDVAGYLILNAGELYEVYN
ncbi:hypothetical protein [Thermospira aquatica]|uniref:Uncharacterized protein n=1 Tax=Thermospira aquatica TaxID=2828656 RepID=A0AAX3BE82_9SPIR|nr:hypothetical protein [Thermospira aquatica]URA10530.1 hypothetical protein KDW03_01635 [Thermospira aquatica]